MEINERKWEMTKNGKTNGKCASGGVGKRRQPKVQAANGRGRGMKSKRAQGTRRADQDEKGKAI